MQESKVIIVISHPEKVSVTCIKRDQKGNGQRATVPNARNSNSNFSWCHKKEKKNWLISPNTRSNLILILPTNQLLLISKHMSIWISCFFVLVRIWESRWTHQINKRIIILQFLNCPFLSPHHSFLDSVSECLLWRNL